MEDSLLANEGYIRIGFFLGTLCVMACLEFFWPRRKASQSKLTRWTNNLLLVVVNTLFVRLILPASAVLVASYAQTHQLGILNIFEIPVLWQTIIAIVVMDLSIYLQHVMVHAIPLFWRFHRVHHADLDYDATTGVRFHPVEILLSMLLKFAVIIMLGASVSAVIIFEILLSTTALFNHGNLKLPGLLDTILRKIIVTPDMHRVHHSVIRYETNSNYGFNLSCWDMLFGTYRAQPEKGHENMTIGIDHINNPKDCTLLHKVLMIPFINWNEKYPINSKNEK